MVGRRVQRPLRTRRTPGRVVLQALGVGLTRSGRSLISEADFVVRAGETLGIIGVSGNGQSGLVDLACGVATATTGTLLLFGSEVRAASPRAFVAAGVGRIPEDRHAEGVVGEMALWENVVLERLHEKRFSRGPFVRRSAARGFARDVVARFDVRGGTVDSATRLLSGGNMQKMILGRSSPRPLRDCSSQPSPHEGLTKARSQPSTSKSSRHGRQVPASCSCRGS